MASSIPANGGVTALSSPYVNILRQGAGTLVYAGKGERIGRGLQYAACCDGHGHVDALSTTLLESIAASSDSNDTFIGAWQQWARVYMNSNRLITGGWHATVAQRS